MSEKYIGTQETDRNNVGKTFDYFRVATNKFGSYNGNLKADPYCATALYAWHLEAGLKPDITNPAGALSWSKCKSPIKLGFATSVETIDRIPPASAITYSVHRKGGFGHHVGLYERRDGFKIVCNDANTSTARSVNKYTRRLDGVYKVRTGFSDRNFMPISACDYVTQSKPFDAKQLQPLKAKYL